MGDKKVTTIHIDKDVLRLAKKNISNLSLFLENCLKAYFGLDNGEFNISDIDTELDKMKMANLAINILSEKNETEKIDRTYDETEANRLWLELWGEYRISESYSKTVLTKLSELIGEDENYLLDIMESIHLYGSKKQIMKSETFSEAKKQYLMIVGIEND